VALPGSADFAERVADSLGRRCTLADVHVFPDGECRVGIAVESAEVIVVASLYRPNESVVPLLFLAETLRDSGVRRIVLAAPYLAYMRQDARFRPGEGISARYFGRLLSRYADALVTVDPHLHRIASLDEVYAIPSRVVHAAPHVADWIRANVREPVIVGPDSESEQWVRDVAARADAPHVVLEKVRKGDASVEIRLPQPASWAERTPVLVDDIISSAGTMIAAAAILKAAGLRDPVCVGVHGIFADDAWRRLHEAGVDRVVTCNTIPHESNAIDIAPAVAAAAEEIRAGGRERAG
jgi:ribose-phosphate pyrophosphokinase